MKYDLNLYECHNRQAPTTPEEGLREAAARGRKARLAHQEAQGLLPYPLPGAVQVLPVRRAHSVEFSYPVEHPQGIRALHRLEQGGLRRDEHAAGSHRQGSPLRRGGATSSGCRPIRSSSTPSTAWLTSSMTSTAWSIRRCGDRPPTARSSCCSASPTPAMPGRRPLRAMSVVREVSAAAGVGLDEDRERVSTDAGSDWPSGQAGPGHERWWRAPLSRAQEDASHG